MRLRRSGRFASALQATAHHSFYRLRCAGCHAIRRGCYWPVISQRITFRVALKICCNTRKERHVRHKSVVRMRWHRRSNAMLDERMKIKIRTLPFFAPFFFLPVEKPAHSSSRFASAVALAPKSIGSGAGGGGGMSGSAPFLPFFFLVVVNAPQSSTSSGGAGAAASSSACFFSSSSFFFCSPSSSKS